MALTVWISSPLATTAQNLALQYTGAAELAVAPVTESLEITGDVTVEVWVRPDDETDNFLNFLLSNNLDGRGWYLELTRNGSDKLPKFQVEGDSNSGAENTAPLPLGAWTHLAGRWSNGMTELYRDGQLVSRVPSPQQPRLSEENLYVGSSPFQLETFMRGQLDEVKVWKGARSQLEIIESMLGRAPSGTETSDAVLVAAWGFDDASASVAPDSSAFGNHLLLGEFGQPAPSLVPSDVPIDGNGPAPTAAIAASALEVIAGEAVHFYDASRGAPSAWSWSFGDGATSTARSPSHSYDAPGQYQVELTAGTGAEARTTQVTVTVTRAIEPTYPTNRALRYAGKGELAAVPESSNLLSPAGPFTVEAWTWSDPANETALSFVLSKNLYATGWALFTVDSEGSRYPFFELNTTPPDTGYQLYANPTSEGAWVHLAGSWENGVLKIFVDGQFAGELAAPIPPTPSEVPLFIGSSLFGSGTYWVGLIDEVRVWGRARSAEEIQSTMNVTLQGNEPGLSAYWTFDDGAGVVARDSAGDNDAFLGVASGFYGVIPPSWVVSDAPVCCGGAAALAVSEEAVLGGAGAKPAVAANRSGLAAVAFSEESGISLMLVEEGEQAGDVPVSRAELYLPDREASFLRVALNEDGDAALLWQEPGGGATPVVVFEAPGYEPVLSTELPAGIEDADLAFSSEGLVVASRSSGSASSDDPAGVSRASAAATIVGRLFRPGGSTQNLGAMTPAGTTGHFDLKSKPDGGVFLAWLADSIGSPIRFPGSPVSAATNVVGRSFQPNGQPAGTSVVVGGGDATSQPDVATDASGKTMVAWQSPKGNGSSLKVRVVSAQNTAGAVREVAVSPEGHTIDSPTLSAGRGGAVVTWGDGSEREDGIRGLALDSELDQTGDFAVVRDRSAGQSSVALGGQVLVAYQGEQLANAVLGDETPRTPSRTAARLVSVETGGCTADALCLAGNRFAVRATWSTADGDSGVANPATLTADTGYFWFFDPDNVEAVIKVLDGCGINDRFWVFAAGLTDVGVSLTVEDTVTGESQTYSNAQGNAFAPIQDTQAFDTCAAAQRSAPAAATTHGDSIPELALRASGEVTRLAASRRAGSSAASAACVSDADTLCLRGGRFEVEVGFMTGQGTSGTAQRAPLTADTGMFSFFDASNVEVVIKVLDGCALNQRYWVFAAGLTDTGVELRVRDTATGQVKRYDNPLGSPFQPILDTSAFATCP